MPPLKVFLSLKKTMESYFNFWIEWQSKVNLFSWSSQDLRYSRLLERHPINNPGLMKRMDLGHDPEPIVVNGRLFPLTSSGFGSGLYYLKWINSQQNLLWASGILSWDLRRYRRLTLHPWVWLCMWLTAHGEHPVYLKSKQNTQKSKHWWSHSEYLV